MSLNNLFYMFVVLFHYYTVKLLLSPLDDSVANGCVVAGYVGAVVCAAVAGVRYGVAGLSYATTTIVYCHLCLNIL